MNYIAEFGEPPSPLAVGDPLHVNIDPHDHDHAGRCDATEPGYTVTSSSPYWFTPVSNCQRMSTSSSPGLSEAKSAE